jgi:hypothetical protein
MATPFKMKGSPMKRNFGISPVKNTEKEAGKKHQHPHTKKESEAIERGKGVLEDRISLTAANKKVLAERKALYDAGKITKEEYDSDKAEISRYVDY